MNEKKYEGKYSIGLDIGISSIGWCAIDHGNYNEGNKQEQRDPKLLDFGVRRFNEAKEASSRRTFRSARRTIRRKRWRKTQLLNAFAEYGLLHKNLLVSQISDNEKESKLDQYLSFSNKKQYTKPNVESVYHLRQKALKEKVSDRELLMCLYNIMQARGHFLMEDVDFEHGNINFEIFFEQYKDIVETFDNLKLPSEQIKLDKIKENLKKVFEQNFNKDESKKTCIKNMFAKQDLFDNEESESATIELLILVCKLKANLKWIDEEKYSKTKNINELKSGEEVSEIEEKLIKLHDIIEIYKILKENDYLCQKLVKDFDKFQNEYINGNKEAKDEAKKYFEDKCINKGERTLEDENGKKIKDENGKKKIKLVLRSIKNLENNYPNGLYVKEVRAILLKQKELKNTKITDEFIEICTSICSARIPYFVGPLGEQAINKWSDFSGKFKYSYEYSKNKSIVNIDEYQNIKKWKKHMISRCTYLKDEPALSKGSFIAELYSVITEINNFKAKDINNEDYALTYNDKCNIINSLFLKQDAVKIEEVKTLLNLSEFGSEKGKQSKFNNKITLYKKIIDIDKTLAFNNVEEIINGLSNNDNSVKQKLNKIENIIEDINLFNEENSKKKYFENCKDYNFNTLQAKHLSKLKSNSTFSLSKKFIIDTPMNAHNESVLLILFSDNNTTEKNNLEVIKKNAIDKNGNNIEFISQKYKEILANNNNELSIKLLMENDKPFMSVSRTVIRSLNEALKIYKQLEDIYGVPNRVVIETARGKDSIKDFTENNVPLPRYKKNDKLLKVLQTNGKKSNIDIIKEKIDDITSNLKNNEKIELYIRQNGIDLLTGEKIKLENINEYEVDHILPRGFGDNSLSNKQLISRKANQSKKNRVPLEYIQSTDYIGKHDVASYKKLINDLYNLKMIDDDKKNNLLLESEDQRQSFINQNLVDTRYIIREFSSILKAYNEVTNKDVHICNLKASVIDAYKKSLDYQKIREVGDQHHAYDAVYSCIVDKLISQFWPNYDERKPSNKFKITLDGKEQELTLSDLSNIFMKNSNSKDKSKINVLKILTEISFNKAYGQLLKNSSLLETIKSQTPLISWKSEKNWDGEICNATLYKPKKSKDINAYDVLGLNNDKRRFGSVKCFGFDVYKSKDKYTLVHIPFAIINQNGSINKEKYIKLIKDYYKKEKDLIIDGNQLNLKKYCFRVNINDLLYDSKYKELYRVNAAGSISNKKIEIKNINTYSYNAIYNKDLYNYLLNNEKLNLFKKENQKGIRFERYLKEEELYKTLTNTLVDYICENAEEKNYIKKLIENKSFQKYCMDNNVLLKTFVAYVCYCYAQITKQQLCNINAINNSERNFKVITYCKEGTIYKIKYNILGVRTNKTKDCFISTVENCGDNSRKYKKIKRETFSWKISKYSV